ncbi:STAS domain-containing protein [Calycomorphotria hydatis]|uniref:STAS domain-containing protein n=1 Tax=Calycomorphotria hydatis TaxID=2528027 RepID=A0A517T702_9PLAN|nr:STAS domain-containing protein [Calycomorphotria hydatis]QDT64151.1 hypothetical protein V22_13820 [Calycomorphotria hydatis]
MSAEELRLEGWDAAADDDSVIMEVGPITLGLVEMDVQEDTVHVDLRAFEVPDEYNLAQYRDEIYELIEASAAKRVRFELDGVKMLPSGLLGMLLGVRKRGVEVELANPSEDIRSMIEITNIGDLLRVVK